MRPLQKGREKEWFVLLLQLLEEILFPRRCTGCGVEIEAGLLCSECRKGLAVMHHFPPVDYLDDGIMMFSYEGCIKEAIHAVKFLHEKSIPFLLAEEAEFFLHEPEIQETFVNFLSEEGKSDSIAEDIHIGSGGGWIRFAEGCVPRIWSGVPTDARRLRLRGFDLPAVLFGKLAPEFGGAWENTLCRTRPTLPMYGLGPAERRENLQECFATVRSVAGKSVLLVDDIFTTGTTFSAAADVLKGAGAASVKGLAFCGSVENLR